MGCYSSKPGSTDIIDGDDGDKKKRMAAEYATEACSLILELRPSNSNVPKLKKLLLNSQNLLFLSKGYLSNVVATKKLLASLKLHLSEARDMQAIILQALKCHHTEDQKKYSLTLQMLREFNEAGNPFTGLFTDEFSLLCEGLQSTVKQLNSEKNKIRKKLSSTKKWKKIWKVLHNAVFITVVVSSVILATLSALPLATVAATAVSTIIKAAEQWVDSIWADQLDVLETKKDVVLMMMKGENMFGIHELDSIQATVKRLEMWIKSIQGDAGLALANQEEEVALKMAIKDIKPKVGEIVKWIDEVEMKMNACDGEIEKAVTKFLNVIMSDL